MPIEFVSGDLFANAYHVAAFVQGCNCQGSMGAGIAKTFRERYPGMEREYRAMCKAQPREFNPGDVWLWKHATQPWVFNLATQENYWRSRATYEAIETSLSRMKDLADMVGITSIAMPRIGAGYGGLSWKKVREIIERLFRDWPGRLVVYETFVTENSDSSGYAGEPVKAKRAQAKSSRAAHRPRFHGHAVTIFCTDVAQSTEFYNRILGARRLPTDEGGSAWFRLGGLRITLVPNAAARSPATFPQHAMPVLWVEVKDLEAATQYLLDQNVRIVERGGELFVIIADPDGLLIEVWQEV